MNLPVLFGLSFANPWLLASLLVLPLLYFLLRILPPPPKQVRLATAHFLGNLTTQSRTSSKTPWWILVLRLLILTLVILAFAGPYRQGTLSGINNSPLLLVIDNSWGAAKNWAEMMQKADSIVRTATENNLTMLVALTAPLPGKTNLEIRGPSDPTILKTFIDAAGPQPIAADFSKLYQELKTQDFRQSILISSGLSGAGASGLFSLMNQKGTTDIILPTETRVPLLLQTTNEDNSTELSLNKTNTVRVLSASPFKASSNETLVGYDMKGEAIFQLPFTFPAKSLSADVALNTIDAQLLDKMSALRIADEQTAGGVFLFGGQSGVVHAGIAVTGQDRDGKELTSAATYPVKALEPYAKITTAPLHDLLASAQNYNLLILPDIATAPTGDLERLSKWVKDGGTLLRFGGTATSRNNTLPSPVPLQMGERALGGSVSWEGQQKLAPFPEQSPFRDIGLSETIIVEKQILARPLQSDDPAIWAELEDGTPFITARAEGRGMIVMVHTTADPVWSDFALSGLYVKILKRIAELSDAPTESFAEKGQSADMLKPLQIIDGFGQIMTPPPYVESLKIGETISPEVTPLTPPGLYGTSARPYPLNLGNTLGRPESIASVAPIGVNILPLSGTTQKDYRRPLMLAAFFLFLIDWASIIYILRLSEWRRMMPQTHSVLRKKHMIIPLVFLLLLTAPSAKAQVNETTELSNINTLSLAYIKTGDGMTDQKSQLGMETLADVLSQRTSVEPEGVKALNPETDDLLFYPFIYWPITSAQQKLSDAAISKLQHYIDRGGLVVLDTGYPASAGADSLVLQNFLQKIDGLNLPPLMPIDKKHTLKRSFYLLDTLYGREDSSEIWVSYDPSSPDASVASILIGGNDWAGGWTGLGVSSPRDQEMALRSGVNITMYALTGNYKADQLHLPIIMERLGP